MNPAPPPTNAWLAGVQFVFGFALVMALGWLGLKFYPQPTLPDGWQIIRPPKDVMALALYHDQIWSGGKDGLYRIDLKQASVSEKVNSPIKFRGVTSLVVDSSGSTLWVGHSEGLSRLDSTGWHTWTLAEGLPDNQVLALCLSQAGELWVGTPHGAALFVVTNSNTSSGNESVSEVFNRSNGLASDAVSVIYQDGQGRVWFGDGFTQQGGLSMYKDRNWQTITAPNQLAHPVVNAILQDQEGILWFGVGFSNRGGVTRFDGQNWSSLGIPDGLAGANTRSLFVDAQGAIWFGSEYDGIARFDGNQWQIFTPKQGLAGWEVKAMLQDGTGAFWLGTENGLSRLDADAWRALGQSNPIFNADKMAASFFTDLHAR